VPLPRFLVDELARTVVNRPSAAMTLDRYADLFDDDLDDVADRLDALRAAARGQVGDFLDDLAPAVAKLDAIPGVGPVAAQMILAEIGTDMTRFPTPAHLTVRLAGSVHR